METDHRAPREPQPTGHRGRQPTRPPRGPLCDSPRRRGHRIRPRFAMAIEPSPQPPGRGDPLARRPTRPARHAASTSAFGGTPDLAVGLARRRRPTAADAIRASGASRSPRSGTPERIAGGLCHSVLVDMPSACVPVHWPPMGPATQDHRAASPSAPVGRVARRRKRRPARGDLAPGSRSLLERAIHPGSAGEKHGTALRAVGRTLRYAPMRCLPASIPCGSRTNFLATPPSKSW